MHVTLSTALLFVVIVQAKHVWTDVKRPEMIYLAFPGHSSHILATSIRELAGKRFWTCVNPKAFITF